MHEKERKKLKEVEDMILEIKKKLREVTDAEIVEYFRRYARRYGGYPESVLPDTMLYLGEMSERLHDLRDLYGF